MTTNEYKFVAEGGYDIDSNLTPEANAFGEVVGFKLPDGRSVRLVIALEVSDEYGDDFKYVTSEQEMSELGFDCLDYERLNFEASK